eukprot:310286-Rhodomonas_salina.1
MGGAVSLFHNTSSAIESSADSRTESVHDDHDGADSFEQVSGETLDIYNWLDPKVASKRMVTAAVNAGPRDHFKMSKPERRHDRRVQAAKSLQAAKDSLSNIDPEFLSDEGVTGDFLLWPPDTSGAVAHSSSQRHLAQLGSKQEVKAALRQRNRSSEIASRMRVDHEFQHQMGIVHEMVRATELTHVLSQCAAAKMDTIVLSSAQPSRLVFNASQCSVHLERV